MSQRRAKTSAASNRGSYAKKENSGPEVTLGTETAIELYTSEDGAVSVPVLFDGETAWATQAQVAELFGTTRPNITMHLRNAYASGEIEQAATSKDFLQVRREGSRDVQRTVTRYDLEAMISVGYRVNSREGVRFRRWANAVLRQRIFEQNFARMRRMDAVADLLATSRNEQLGAIGRIMQRYAGDLDRLADYDRGSLTDLEETQSAVALDINDVEGIVDELRDRYPDDARLGLMKDDSVHAVLGQIEQTFMGVPLYGSAEEKAANLLYVVVKDHPFHDGNKRSAAALFAYYLDRNNIELDRAIPGNMLTALTLIAAASDPKKKDETVSLIRSLLE